MSVPLSVLRRVAWDNLAVVGGGVNPDILTDIGYKHLPLCESACSLEWCDNSPDFAGARETVEQSRSQLPPDDYTEQLPPRADRPFARATFVDQPHIGEPYFNPDQVAMRSGFSG